MAVNIKYGALNIPEALIDELKVWKMAFSMSCGRTVSYAEMIRSLLDSVPKSDPEVSGALEKLLEMNPELKGKMGGNNQGRNLEKNMEPEPGNNQEL